MTQSNTAKALLLKNGEWTSIEDFVSVDFEKFGSFDKALEIHDYEFYRALSVDMDRTFLTIWKNTGFISKPKFYVSLEISDDFPDYFYLQDVPDLLKFMADSKQALDLFMQNYKENIE